jgi:hypothetical protein
VSGEVGDECEDARGGRDGGDRLGWGISRNCRVEREPAGGTAGAGADLVPGSAGIAGSRVKGLDGLDGWEGGEGGDRCGRVGNCGNEVNFRGVW